MFSTRIEHYSRISSTMEILRKRAEAGEEEGLVLWADEIEQAQGRHNRKWYADSGGLWLSVLLRPKIPALQAGLFNYLASVTLHKSLLHFGSLAISVKWPNDIVWDQGNRKVGGILVWGKVQGQEVDYLIWGIGVNGANQLPPEMDSYGLKKSDQVATTLKKEGWDIGVEPLVNQFLNNLEDSYKALQQGVYSFSHLREDFQKICSTLGRSVKVYFSKDDWIEGRAREIDSKTGALLVETAEGLKRVDGGDCFHLREA